MAIAVSGWALLWLAAGDLVVEPDPASREYVEEQLGSAHNLPLPLPVRLPAGYEPPDDYSTSINEDGIPYAWGARFHPIGEQAPKGAPVVVMCAQSVDAPDKPCAPPPTLPHVERTMGPTQLVMWAEYPPTASLDQWNSLELTTDLDKVTWLN